MQNCNNYRRSINSILNWNVRLADPHQHLYQTEFAQLRSNCWLNYAILQFFEQTRFPTKPKRNEPGSIDWTRRKPSRSRWCFWEKKRWKSEERRRAAVGKRRPLEMWGLDMQRKFVNYGIRWGLILTLIYHRHNPLIDECEMNHEQTSQVDPSERRTAAVNHIGEGC